MDRPGCRVTPVTARTTIGNDRIRTPWVGVTIGEGGPLYHVWQEPPSAPYHRQGRDTGAELAFHGPDLATVVPLLQVDGHLRWLAPAHPPFRPVPPLSRPRSVRRSRAPAAARSSPPSVR